MFKWAYCYGCDEEDTCTHDGKYWECPYSDAIQEDIDREESEDF